MHTLYILLLTIGVICLVSRLSGDPQGHSRWTYPSGPDPLRTHLPRPDLDPILTRKGRFQVQIGSKSGLRGGVGGVGAREVGPAGMALWVRPKVLSLVSHSAGICATAQLRYTPIRVVYGVTQCVPPCVANAFAVRPVFAREARELGAADSRICSRGTI